MRGGEGSEEMGHDASQGWHLAQLQIWNYLGISERAPFLQLLCLTPGLESYVI